MKLKAALVFLIILLSCFAAIAGEKRFNIAVDNSPEMGPKDAPVTIFEFLDFQ